MTNFEKSSLFNNLFGNAKGNPSDLDWGAIRTQFQLIKEEFEELANAIDQHDVTELRDGAADLLETTYGLFHRTGFDANKDYHNVWESNMSKFCANADEAIRTATKYEEMGIASDYRTVEGYVAVVSNEDQCDKHGKFFPKGKLLKSINFKSPEFV